MVGLNWWCAQSRFSSILFSYIGTSQASAIVWLHSYWECPQAEEPWSQRPTDALVEETQPPLGLDTAGQPIPCFPPPSPPASGHPWSVSCSTRRRSRSNTASSAASAAPRSRWGNPRTKQSARPLEKSCSAPAARSWVQRRRDVDLEKQQKQRCSRRAIRDKSCDLPLPCRGEPLPLGTALALQRGNAKMGSSLVNRIQSKNMVRPVSPAPRQVPGRDT